MTLFNLWALISILPELIKLVKAIEAKNKELELEAKTRDDIKKITEAFKNRNAKALHDIFNN